MFDLIYYVDNVTYHNKADAYIAAKGNPNKIKGSIFNDRLYNFIWDVEPPESFDNLLKQRAQQLREQYSELSLLFSGGRDSFTVLETFSKNNIHLDNVILLLSEYGATWDRDLGNWDYIHVAKPILKEYELLLPKTKFSYIIERNLKSLDDFDYHIQTNGLNTKFRIFMPTSLEHYWKSHNHTYITGCLEPRVCFYDNSWHFEIWDTDNPETYRNLRNTVPFFTHPDFPQLHSKQCHLVKKYLINKGEKNNELGVDSLDYLQSVGADPNSNIKNLLCRDTHPLIEKYSLIKGQKRSKFMYLNTLKTLSKDYRKKFIDLHNYKIGGIPLKNLRIGVKVFSVSV